jgi:hypothetical protein
MGKRTHAVKKIWVRRRQGGRLVGMLESLGLEVSRRGLPLLQGSVCVGVFDSVFWFFYSILHAVVHHQMTPNSLCKTQPQIKAAK